MPILYILSPVCALFLWGRLLDVEWQGQTAGAYYTFEHLTCPSVMEDGAHVLLLVLALDSYLSLWGPSRLPASKS